MVKRFIGQNQSHYREVARWEIFMEQELRFGPVRQLLRSVFSCFNGQKKIKNIVDSENMFGIDTQPVWTLF